MCCICSRTVGSKSSISSSDVSVFGSYEDWDCWEEDWEEVASFSISALKRLLEAVVTKRCVLRVSISKRLLVFL